MKQKNRLNHLLTAYLENRCFEAEFSELLVLLERAEQDPEIKQTLHTYWQTLSIPPTGMPPSMSEDPDLWFEEIYTEARMREGQITRPQPVHRRAHRRSGMLLRVAAILVLALSLSLAWLTLNPLSKGPSGESTVTMVEKRADRGEKVRFSLPDGTQVHLNSDSRLRFESPFGDSLRDVHLEGEGYFVVARNEEKPFVVHANGVRTRVLGTSFNVRSYGDQARATVAVTHGRVSVQELREESADEVFEPIILEAGQWANYDTSTDRISRGEGDLTEWVAWNEGVFLYSDKKLAEVANELERWYGVDIQFADPSLGECVIRGEHRNEVLENVLNAIGYAFDIDYRIEGRLVTLSGEGCESQNR
ncbi:MAG: FecR domain-containing protein [Balneolaceae bacterium]